MARFWRKVDRSGDEDACWLWTATLTRHGEGRFWNGTSLDLAIRWIYEQTHGPIPFALWVWQSCGNPGCVNPRHLYLDQPNPAELLRRRQAREVAFSDEPRIRGRRRRRAVARAMANDELTPRS